MDACHISATVAFDLARSNIVGCPWLQQHQDGSIEPNVSTCLGRCCVGKSRSVWSRFDTNGAGCAGVVWTGFVNEIYTPHARLRIRVPVCAPPCVRGGPPREWFGPNAGRCAFWAGCFGFCAFAVAFVRVRATALSCVPRCTMINDNVIHNSPQALAERADGTLFSVRGPGGARTQRRSGYVAEPRGAPRAPEVP